MLQPKSHSNQNKKKSEKKAKSPIKKTDVNKNQNPLS